MSDNVRVRFAPSPTGYLHVGGLRTALYNWLFARQNGGTFILRIEDTDQSRKVAGAVESLQNELSWAGLDIDEGPGEGGDAGPYVQSERLEIYDQHAARLVKAGHAYACFCTSERLQQLRERQQKMGLATRYDGHCRDIPTEEAAQRSAEEAHVIRLAVPREGLIILEDVVRRKVRFEWQTVDDQVLIKSDGFPTYHLANVVDDHLMGVTHVIRGEEWLPSMPKHLLLYQGFGWDIPVFAHLPLLLNPDRSKLSKRHGHVAVEEYRKEGYLPQALINFVALLGWHDQSNTEVFDLQGLQQAFQLERVQKGGAIFDTGKLKWLNGQHLRRMPAAEFRQAIAPHLEPGWEVTARMAAAIQEKISLLTDARDQLAFFFEDPVSYDEAASEALASPHAKGILTALLDRLAAVDDFSGEWFLEAVKALGAEFGLKGRELWHPIRAAIAGRVVGPDMVTIVETFGLDKCRQRVTAALQQE